MSYLDPTRKMQFPPMSGRPRRDDARRHLLQRLQRGPPAGGLPALRQAPRRGRHRGRHPLRGADAGRPRLGAGAADARRVHRLRLLDRREPLPRPALRARPCALPVDAPRWPRAPATWSCADKGIIRIYDVLFEQEVLLDTDDWLYRCCCRRSSASSSAPRSCTTGSAATPSPPAASAAPSPVVLATAYECDVPIFAPSPGDSTVGMNVSALWTARPEAAPVVNPAIDVAETAGHRPRRQARRAALGGGHPRRRRAQELPAPDRAAAPGGAGHRRARPRLLHPGHRRPPRHRRPLRRHPVRGRVLGQDRPRPAPQHRRLLPRLDRGPADHRHLRPRQGEAPRSPAASCSACPSWSRSCAPSTAPPSCTGAGGKARRQGRGERGEGRVPRPPNRRLSPVLSPLPWSGGGCYTSFPGVGL